jgi:hypothetical protein
VVLISVAGRLVQFLSEFPDFRISGIEPYSMTPCKCWGPGQSRQ